MSSIDFEKFIELIKEYNEEEVEIITKAYNFAKELHKGQYRQSGEEYIIHPLNVAYILASMKADRDTVCAGLLHDVLEDTNITKEELSEMFSPVVANLVDGVTKFEKFNFKNKEEMDFANTRKIIAGITEDVRIIIIKLADRLHNMRTLMFKSKEKQKENALETMKLFVPLAYYIGAQNLKNELEDLSFKYLKPEMYNVINSQKIYTEHNNKEVLNEMLSKIKKILDDKNIPNEIKFRTKNIYSIYQKLERGQRFDNIHDMFIFKIVTKEIEDCYKALYYIHSLYHSINIEFKDYICNPKTVMYRSLHTTIFAENDNLVQAQIRTNVMDQIAENGLIAYWDFEKGKAKDIMQDELKQNFQFFKSISELNEMFTDNEQFINEVDKEIFTDRIYVYTIKGDIIELPTGSSPVDFAYRIHSHIGNQMVSAVVNDEIVPFDYELKSRDRVKIIIDEMSLGPTIKWLQYAKTSTAKKKIKEYIRNKRNVSSEENCLVLRKKL